MTMKAKTLGILLIIGILTATAAAEGNITTTSGNLYLQPAGGQVILSAGARMALVNPAGTDVASILVNGSDAIFNMSGIGGHLYFLESNTPTFPSVSFAAPTGKTADMRVLSDNVAQFNLVQGFDILGATTPFFGMRLKSGGSEDALIRLVKHNTMPIKMAPQSGLVRFVDYDALTTPYLEINANNGGNDRIIRTDTGYIQLGDSTNNYIVMWDSGSSSLKKCRLFNNAFQCSAR
jgi:hypothetical protein